MCNDETPKLMKTVYCIQEKQLKTESDLQKLSKETCDKFTKVENDLVNIKKGTFRDGPNIGSYKQTENDIEKQIESKLGSVAADVEQLNKAVDSAKSLAAEQQDKENRQCNIILYEVPESTDCCRRKSC